MAERTREGIDKDIGLVPAGFISELGGSTYLSPDDIKHDVVLKVPAVGASPLELTGKCDARTLRISIPESEKKEAGSLKTDLTILADIQDKLDCFVEVVVAADETLVAELPGKVYVDPTCEITRQQIARELALEEAQITEFYWDLRLEFPLLTLADPLFHFSGTFIGLLETLIAPYKFSGVSLAEIIIEPDSVRIVYVNSGLQSVVPLVIGSDIYLSGFTIRRGRPKQLKEASASWYIPKELKEETITLTDERLDKDGFVIGKTVRILTMIGNVLLEEQELNYVQLIINWMVTGGPMKVKVAEQDPMIHLQYKKIIQYTYDPVPNELNVHYVRNFKLTERDEFVTYYIPSTNEDQMVWHTDEVLSSYTYTEDGKLSCETQRTAKNRAGYEESGYVQGEITEIKYFSISEDMYQLSKNVSRFNAYVTAGDETWPAPGDISPLSHITQTVMGDLPSPPSIPTPKNEDYVENKERKEELDTHGLVAHVELYFDPEEVFDLYLDRVTSAMVRVSMSGRCLYDLRPGLWIHLSIAKDITITTRSPSGSNEVLKLSEILDTLPDLFVKAVTVDLSDKEQTTNIEAVGWTSSRALPPVLVT